MSSSASGALLLPRHEDPEAVHDLSPALHNFVFYLTLTLLSLWLVRVLSQYNSLVALYEAFKARNLVRLDGLTSSVREVGSLSRQHLQQLLTLRSTFNTTAVDMVDLPMHAVKKTISIETVVGEEKHDEDDEKKKNNDSSTQQPQRLSGTARYFVKMQLTSRVPVLVRVYIGLATASVNNLYTVFRQSAADADDKKKKRQRKNRKRKKQKKDARQHDVEVSRSSSWVSSAKQGDIELDMFSTATGDTGGGGAVKRSGDGQLSTAAEIFERSASRQSIFADHDHLAAADPVWVPAGDKVQVRIQLDKTTLMRAAMMKNASYAVGIYITNTTTAEQRRYERAECTGSPSNNNNDDNNNDNNNNDNNNNINNNNTSSSSSASAASSASTQEANVSSALTLASGSASASSAAAHSIVVGEHDGDDEDDEKKRSDDMVTASLTVPNASSTGGAAPPTMPAYDVAELTVLQVTGRSNVTGDNITSSSSSSSSSPPAQNIRTRVDRQLVLSRALRRLLELEPVYGVEDDEPLECTICFSEQRDMILLPCRHLGVCHNCLENCRGKCPMCRSQVLSFLRFSESRDDVMAAIMQSQVDREADRELLRRRAVVQ